MSYKDIIAGLTGTDLDKSAKGIMAALHNVSPTEIDLTGLNDQDKRDFLNDSVSAFDANVNGAAPTSITDLANKDVFAKDEDTPHSRLINIADKAVKGGTLTQDETYLFHALLTINGQTNNFDNEITADELKAAEVVIEGYQSGNSTAQNHLAADQTRAAELAVQKAAEQAAAEELVAKEKVANENRVAAAVEKIKTEEIKLTESFSLSALGLTGTPFEQINQFTTDHQQSLQRHSKEIFGESMNIHEIQDKMLNDKGTSNKALAYVIQSGDFRDKVVNLLDNGKFQAAKIIMRQSGVEIDLSASFDEAAKATTKEYLQKEHGLGDDNFAFTASPRYEAFVHAHKGMVHSEDAMAQFQEANPNAHVYNIATSVLARNIESGVVPILEEEGLLPSYVHKLEGHTQAMAIATYLSHEDNFKKYDEALKNRDISGLENDLDAIDNVSETVLTGELVAKHQYLAKKNTEETPKFLGEQEGIADKITDSGQDNAYNSIYERIPADFPINENTPIEVQNFAKLKGEIDTAEDALKNYQSSPGILNKNNTLGPDGDSVTFVGFTGGQYPLITQALKNNITQAENSHMKYFDDLSPESKQNTLTYLDNPDKAAIENSTASADSKDPVKQSASPIIAQPALN